MRADNMGTGGDSSPARPPQSSGRRARALPLVVCASALLLSALAALSLGTPATAQGRALVPEATPTRTPTPTKTPTATASAGTITLVSPSYGTGPSGAHVTVSGSGFSGSTLALQAASHADCSSSQATLAHVSLGGGSFTNQSFIWPSGLPNGTYYICGGGTTNGPAYQQLTGGAPAISLSAPSVVQEGQLVISGANFAGIPAGSSIQLTAEQGSAQSTLPSGVIDANGQFTVPWTVDVSFTGTVVIVAQSSPEGSAPSVLQASASVTIIPPATATASATASATTTPSGAGAGVSSSGNSGSGGGGALVLVIVLLIVVLLVGGGAAAFVLLRRGGAGGPQTPNPRGAGGYPGYSPYGSYSPSGNWDATTERMSGAGFPGQYGGQGTGSYGAPEGYSGGGVGAVSQWGEPTEEYGDEPSASWQPRPMTGYGNYQHPAESEPGAGYAPADPWGETGAYGDYGGGQGSYGGQGGYGGYGTGAGDGGWRNQEQDGPGAMRPGGGAPERYPQQPGQGYPYPQSQRHGQRPDAGWPDDAPPPDDWRQSGRH